MEKRRILAVLFSFFLISFFTNPASVLGKEDRQGTDSTYAVENLVQKIEGLTQTLKTIGGRPFRAINSPENLADSAASRKQLLMGLIEKYPREVLRQALPANVRADLPSEVQPYLEEHVEVEGELEILAEDFHGRSRLRHFLRPLGKRGEKLGKRLSLHFARELPDHLYTGSKILARGVQIENALALESGYTSLEPFSSTFQNTFGEQRTAVILVNFQDKPTQAWLTVAQAQDIVFNTASPASVTNYFLEVSYGQTWLTGNVYGIYTIPVNSTVCDPFSIATYAKEAASREVGAEKLSTYSRFVFAFPGNACSWWGAGTVGGNPSQSWINGSFENSVVIHEMGHNFGLYHSHSLDCGSVSIGSNCSSIEYGDILCSMGSATPPKHFNAVQKELLGWLDYGTSPPITTVQTSGVYTLDPIESPGSGPKALRVRRPSGEWYYVEYRQPIGFDYSTVSANPNFKNGVVLHVVLQQSANGIYLLDMTPDTASWSDATLTLNRSFTDAAAGIAITPLWLNSTAGVQVTVGGSGPPCVRANPSVSISPWQSQAVQGGTEVTYTASVTNNDGAGCPTASFNLQETLPNNWNSILGVRTLSLSPGASGTTTLKVTSPTSVAPGSYPVGISVTNTVSPTYSASASTAYVVSSRKTSVTVSTDRLTYSRKKTVTITATVKDGGVPVAEARVLITVERPDKTVIEETTMTPRKGNKGVVKVSFRTSEVGTYIVKAVADKGGIILGSATTSFTVK